MKIAVFLHFSKDSVCSSSLPHKGIPPSKVVSYCLEYRTYPVDIPDQNWGRDKNEDDILWTRRCFCKALEMVTTPVVRRGMRR